MSFQKLAEKSYSKNRKSILDFLEDEFGLIKCGGCLESYRRRLIEVHHIIKRSSTIYLYAYIPNLFPLCTDCHRKTEDKESVQRELKCYHYLVEQEEVLKKELQEFLSKVGKPDECDLLEFWGLNN